MKKIYLSAACVAGALVAGTASVAAHEHGKKKEMMSGHHAMSSTVSVQNVWARATPGMAKNGGGYFTVINGGKTGDRITGVSASVSERTELHTHINDGGIMRMREVKAIEVPAGATVTAKPGGYHIMFIGLHKPLKKGDSFPVTLTFEKAGKKTVQINVMGVGAMKGGGSHHKHGTH